MEIHVINYTKKPCALITYLITYFTFIVIYANANILSKEAEAVLTLQEELVKHLAEHATVIKNF